MTPDDIKQLARDDEMKRVMKEAILEWLNEQFAHFGRLTFYALLSAVIAGAGYVAFIGLGYHK